TCVTSPHRVATESTPRPCRRKPSLAAASAWRRVARPSAHARSSRPLRRRLEQLDEVAGGILYQDLLTAVAHDDLVAESSARRPQSLDLAPQVHDLELDAVPAARLGLVAVGHRLARSAAAPRRAPAQAP